MWRRHRWEPVGTSKITRACARCHLRQVDRIGPYARLWVKEYTTGDGRYLGVLDKTPSCPPPADACAIPRPRPEPAPPPPAGPLPATAPMRMPPAHAVRRAPVDVRPGEWVYGVEDGSDVDIWDCAITLKRKPVCLGTTYRLTPDQTRPDTYTMGLLYIPATAVLWTDPPKDVT
ncbi:hypothetical protein ACFFMN_23540 [Planobispora siamensis]|uniref:Uncharacterized protein n=1 Tax=Planobispora siamensis TaxID=936338 RepID=A0A8J3STI5_9ACTN|nr:hypothetical protein [Planobispora siamensis]GIH95338.1 hypothetical protein Psi01_59680 [Planobispora siamensis]